MILKLHQPHCYREQDGLIQRLCKPCKRWKAFTFEFFSPLRGDRKNTGLNTICRICIAAQTRARYNSGIRHVRYVKHMTEKEADRALKRADWVHKYTHKVWPAHGWDRETMNLLHAATAGWPTTEEGRVWMGR